MASQAVKGGGKLYIRIFPHKSVTAIPAETRMGKGKGEVEFWAAVVKPGTILYEVSGLSEEAARTVFARVAHKMPVTCRFVTRRPTRLTGCDDIGDRQPGSDRERKPS